MINLIYTIKITLGNFIGIKAKLWNISLKIEYWDGNTFYGIGNILRQYSGLPFFYPLNFHIQHGIVFFENLNSTAINENLEFYGSTDNDCIFLMFNENCAEHIRKFKQVNVKAIGAPIIYLDEYISNKHKNNRRGTIVFPSHGIEQIDIITDYEKYITELLNLPSFFSPITICMHYMDVQRGYSKPFIDRGFTVLCNGDLRNPFFLYNFIDNCAGFEYATTNNENSSAPYYAIYLGLKVFTYGPPSQMIPLTDSYNECIKTSPDIKHNNFPIELVEDYNRQKAIAYNELGVHLRHSKTEMRKLLISGLSKKFINTYLNFLINKIPYWNLRKLCFSCSRYFSSIFCK